MAEEVRVSAAARGFLVALGVLLAAIGLFLLIGGVELVRHGGSSYYVAMGLASTIAGVLVSMRRPMGALLYAIAFLLTLVWAVWDAGWAFWPLFSRLFVPAALALLVALAWPLLRRSAGLVPGRSHRLVAGVLFVGLAIGFASAFMAHGVITNAHPPAVSALAAGTGQIGWRHWGGTTAGTRFAALDQITRNNVTGLKVAWTFRHGDFPVSTGAGAEDQNTPLQVGDTLYYCNAYGKAFALDVDTGVARWKYDPKGSAPNWQRCRGMGYYEDAISAADTVPSAAVGSPTPEEVDVAAPSACAARVFLPTIDARLIALDAATGKPCADFGNGGTVDLSTDMGEIKPGYYQQTSTPLVAGNLVVVGGRVADNWSTGEPPGVVRAFDVHSGELAWAWDPGNPATTLRPPPGQTYTRGTPNVWSAMAYDPALGLIYLPTGNATPDFWAGSRTELDDKYSAAVVAVEATTGRVRWLYQMTHHDLWDFDIPAQPALQDLPDGKGGVVPALVQVTKQGMIFVLDRQTGKPLFEVEERPVPQGNVPGERYSATQPFSIGLPNIGNETLVESDMWGATLLDQLLCRIQFSKMRHQGVYTPPGLDRALQYPGSLGGMNWGGVSIDPTTHYLFVNDMRIGLANYMIPRKDMPADASGIEMGAVPQEGTPFGAMRERFMSPLGVPCQKPPFGTMSAIDLVSGELKWQVPVGTVRDTGPLGIKMLLPMPVGMPTLGGSLATQSGLLFFSGSQDYYLRAYDSGSGRELWKARLPVGSQSGPMTFVSPKTGRQYVVVTAGGARVSPDRGDYVIAYALPAAP